MKKMLAMLLLAALMPAAATASDVEIYPIAMVSVNADSWLNVRSEPEGDLVGFCLMPRTDVVILAEAGEWALVNTIPRANEGKEPIGWASLKYLIKYRGYVLPKKDAQRGNAGQ